MDALTSNIFLAETEELLSGLGLDVDQAKQVFPTGIQFRFNWNDTPIYLALPCTYTNSYTNIARLEATIAELNEVDAGNLTVAIVGYLYNDLAPIKVTTRQTKNLRVEILLSFVADLQLLQKGSLATILSHLCEEADYLRNEFVTKAQKKRA